MNNIYKENKVYINTFSKLILKKKRKKFHSILKDKYKKNKSKNLKMK